MNKNTYKLELHAHNYEESCDSLLTGEELLDAVKSEGYDGIIITNHYDKATIAGMVNPKTCSLRDKGNKDCFKCPLLNIPFTKPLIQQAIQNIYESRKHLQQYAKQIGIAVYFGVEWENKQTVEIPQLLHFLLLGQTNEEFLHNPPPPYTTLSELLTWKQQTNSIVILNHCNRYVEECSDYMYIDNKLGLIDGYEVYNYKNNKYKDTNQDISPFLISKIGQQAFNNSIHLSGGDIHAIEHLGGSGLIIQSDHLPADERELQTLIKQGNYTLIKGKQQTE